MIGLNADRADGDVRATTQQVEQPHTELARETFVDDLQRLQTFTNDAALGIRVIGANIAIARFTRFRIIAVIAVALSSASISA